MLFQFTSLYSHIMLYPALPKIPKMWNFTWMDANVHWRSWWCLCQISDLSLFLDFSKKRLSTYGFPETGCLERFSHNLHNSLPIVRISQSSILFYIICWALLHEKGYQVAQVEYYFKGLISILLTYNFICWAYQRNNLHQNVFDLGCRQNKNYTCYVALGQCWRKHLGM